MAYESYFGYNLHRRYPFKWFTWVAVILFSILSALFSAANVAFTGYDTDVFYTSEPNMTESAKFWYDYSPFSWASKPSSTCQSTSLAIGTTLYTNNRNFAYTVTGAQSLMNGQWATTPSVPYHNAELSSCAVGAIKMTTGPPNLEFEFISDWLNVLETRIYCNISSNTALNLSVTYTQHYAANAMDPQTQASLWWGQKIIGRYMSMTSAEVGSFRSSWDKQKGANDTSKMLANYFFWATPPSLSPRTPDQQNVSSADFYQYTYLLQDKSGAIGGFPESTFNTSLLRDYDRLIKSFYSTIMADLGQAGTNLLTDPVLLQNYTAYEGGSRTYDDLTRQGVTGPLGITPSTFYVQYLCRVPRLKPPGALVAAVFLANLVYLTAAWRLYNWLATSWLERRDGEAMRCAGCVAVLERPDKEVEAFASLAKSVSSGAETPLLRAHKLRWPWNRAEK